MADVHLDGPITKETVDDLISRLKPGDTLTINSRGGSMVDAGRLAKHVRQNNINTHARATSNVQSTALLVFSAGKKRSASPNTLFHFHTMNRDGEMDNEATSLFMRGLQAMGVNDKIWGVLANKPGNTRPITFDEALRSNLVNMRQSRILEGTE